MDEEAAAALRPGGPDGAWRVRCARQGCPGREPAAGVPGAQTGREEQTSCRRPAGPAAGCAGRDGQSRDVACVLCQEWAAGAWQRFCPAQGKVEAAGTGVRKRGAETPSLWPALALELQAASRLTHEEGKLRDQLGRLGTSDGLVAVAPSAVMSAAEGPVASLGHTNPLATARKATRRVPWSTTGPGVSSSGRESACSLPSTK